MHAATVLCPGAQDRVWSSAWPGPRREGREPPMHAETVLSPGAQDRTWSWPGPRRDWVGREPQAAIRPAPEVRRGISSRASCSCLAIWVACRDRDGREPQAAIRPAQEERRIVVVSPAAPTRPQLSRLSPQDTCSTGSPRASKHSKAVVTAVQQTSSRCPLLK